MAIDETQDATLIDDDLVAALGFEPLDEARVDVDGTVDLRDRLDDADAEVAGVDTADAGAETTAAESAEALRPAPLVFDDGNEANGDAEALEADDADMSDTALADADDAEMVDNAIVVSDVDSDVTSAIDTDDEPEAAIEADGVDTPDTTDDVVGDDTDLVGDDTDLVGDDTDLVGDDTDEDAGTDELVSEVEVVEDDDSIDLDAPSEPATADGAIDLPSVDVDVEGAELADDGEPVLDLDESESSVDAGEATEMVATAADEVEVLDLDRLDDEPELFDQLVDDRLDVGAVPVDLDSGDDFADRVFADTAVEPHPTSVEPLVVEEAVVPAVAPAQAPRRFRRKRKLRARKSRRVVRHIDPWSVLTFSVIFHMCVFGALLLGSVLVWNAAIETGMVDNVESFIQELGDYETFEINADVMFRAAVVIAGMLTLASSVLVVLLTVVFNLISDLIGGIRVTVIEEETVRIPIDPEVTSSS